MTSGTNRQNYDVLLDAAQESKLFSEWSHEGAGVDIVGFNTALSSKGAFRRLAKAVWRVKRWRARCQLRQLFRMLE